MSIVSVVPVADSAAVSDESSIMASPFLPATIVHTQYDIIMFDND